MTTCQKHADFIRESMKGKEISDIAGVGVYAGVLFKLKGINNACQLFGQFLIMGMDENVFCSWLETEISQGNTMNPKQRHEVYLCLKGWADRFL